MKRILTAVAVLICAACLGGCASVGWGGDSTSNSDDNRSFHDANDQANAAQAAAAAQNASDASQAAAAAAISQ